MLIAAIGTPCIIIKKFLCLICAPSPKVYKMFYDFFVYFLEIFESNVFIIFPPPVSSHWTAVFVKQLG